MKWKEWSKFASNESNWRNHHEKGLLKAEYIKDYVLRLWFEEELDISISDFLISAETVLALFYPECYTRA